MSSGLRSSTVQDDRKCQFCSRAFLKSEHLSRHIRTHTKEKPYSCSVCQKSYARNDALLRHKRSHRNGADSSKLRTPSTRIHGESLDSTHLVDPQNRRASHEATPASCINQIWTDTPHISSSHDHTVFTSAGQLVQSDPNVTGKGVDNFEYDLENDELWNDAYDPHWSAWSVGSDFDLEAMNASIAATITQQNAQMQNYDQEYGLTDDSQLSSMQQRTAEEKAAERMERNWFSHPQRDTKSHIDTGTVTPVIDNDNVVRTDVDEVYRYNLTSRLQHRPWDNSLPSTEFLNLAVRLYFSRFHPIFPIIHAPTFRPSIAKSLLLLSICSIGSLFIGSPGAITQGTKLFETLNKSIVNSWERYVTRSGAEALSMIQAAVIGQTFAVLSGNPSHLNLVEAYHGTIIAWARQSKMFKEQHLPLLIDFLGENPSQEDLDKVWLSWTKSEERLRVVIGLHIHDAELAAMFHHEPILRHVKERRPFASNERLFNAPTALQWLAVSRKSRRDAGLPARSSLNDIGVYAALEGIRAAICEDRQQDRIDEARQSLFVSDLMAWQQALQSEPRDQDSDPFCLMILWHETFMSLFVDFDKMECAIGKNGIQDAAQSKVYVMSWVSSASATRCIRHAWLLQRQAGNIQIGREPAIHVPQCLFRAALVWYLYAHNAPTEESEDLWSFPEIERLGVAMPAQLFQCGRREAGKPTPSESSTIYALKDLLQRVGQWGLSRKYGSTLELLMEGETDSL